jgi:formyl-CoA transferase
MDGLEPRDFIRWTGPAVGQHNDYVFGTLLAEETLR